MRPSLSYFVCTSPRSGSTLLTDALFAMKIAGRPQEYFDKNYEQLWVERLGVTSDADYIEKVLVEGSTPNGVFGLKVFWFQLELLVDKLSRIHDRSERDFSLLETTFPNLRFVFLKRKDKVRQAISWVKAGQTEMWWLIPGAPGGRTTPKEEPKFDFQEIDRRVRFLTELEQRWTRFFDDRGLQPLTLEYEDYIQAYESTIIQVLDYLGISIPPGLSVPPPRLIRQSDRINEEWAERYLRLKQESATPSVNPTDPTPPETAETPLPQAEQPNSESNRLEG
jgi:LPS sulfotransferase NodH